MRNTIRDWRQNWRLKVAKYLLLRSEYSVCRTEEVDRLRGTVSSMIQYAYKSGGLSEPRRIRARKKVLQYGEQLLDRVSNVIVA